MLQISQNKGKPFHLRYLELCKNRNTNPLPEIKTRNKEFGTLDFFGDRVRVDDWLLIFNALYYDTSLHFVAIKLRKNATSIIESLNSLKKTRKSQGITALLSNCLFSQFIDTISFVIGNNLNLTTLMLEGLPLRENYITYICKALASNSSIKNLSFARSALGDDGCEIVCSTIKHLTNIDSLNLSQCMLTAIGAESVAKMIKFQKILRFSEGWEKTLRYRSVNPDSLAGLKRITLNCNVIRDEGIQYLIDVLKEDVWIKIIEVQSCHFGDKGAKSIIDCLNLNHTLLLVDIEDNPQISFHLIEYIRAQFSFDAETYVNLNGTDSGKIKQKQNMQEMKEKVKFVEQQLQTEVFRRKQTELVNENLHFQLMEFQKKLSTLDAFRIPDGYTLIENVTFEKLLQERDELTSIVQSNRESTQSTEGNGLSISAPKKQKIKLSRTKSDVLPSKYSGRESNKESKSQSRLFSVFEGSSGYMGEPQPHVFLERQIGDTLAKERNCEGTGEILKIFMKRKSTAASFDDSMSFGDSK